MTRFQLVTPNVDNDGRNRPHGSAPSYGIFARRAIQETFDGATGVQATGLWANAGATSAEPVTVWTIDAEANRARDVIKVAHDVAIYAAQQAVYVSAQDAAGIRRVFVGQLDSPEELDRHAAELAGAVLAELA